MQSKESKINWKLPLYGAAGFGLGFALFLAAAFELKLMGIYNLAIGAVLIALFSGIGGAILGFALEDRKKIFYLSVACAVGFALGLVIGLAAVYLTKFSDILGSFIMGAFGGAAIGIALKDKKKIIYLSLAGAAGFCIGFLIADLILYPVTDLIGNLIAGAGIGAVGGWMLGLAIDCNAND
jgi:hypothetical protein